MPASFEIYKDRKGEFRYRLKATNGEIIMTGEGYGARAGVLKGVESIRVNSQLPARFEIKSGRGGKCRSILKSRNGRIIGQTEAYESEASCKKGIRSIAKNAPKAKLKDLC